MWALESLAEIPLKKTFIGLTITLGAAFLLLAFFLSVQPLRHPITYVIVVVFIWMSQRSRNLVALIICAALTAGAAWLLLPRYLLPFALGVTLLIGRVFFAQTFRNWKWLTSASLLYISMIVTGAWQQIPLPASVLPVSLQSALHGAIFAFCCTVSFLPLQLKKNMVVHTFDTYEWLSNSEAKDLATRIINLYRGVQCIRNLPEGRKKDLEEHTASMIDCCWEVHTIEAELSALTLFRIEEDLRDLTARMNSAKDAAARMQYEQAVKNKERQREQLENLQMRQERIRARLLHYITALENVRFATTNHTRPEETAETIDFFLDVLKAEV